MKPLRNNTCTACGASTLLVILLASPGCTTVSLSRNVIEQSGSLSDMRYREVVENLAAIAHSPPTLPAYSSIYAGTTDVTDSGMMNSQTTWVRTLLKPTTFSTESLDIPLKRTIKDNWTLNPILAPEKLRAMRCCCWWALFGPENSCGDCSTLKRYDRSTDCPGYYFDVEDRLAALPPRWLHFGTCAAQVPSNACYHAECHGTHVWVTAEGMQGLSDFTLILQRIARTDLPSVYQPKPQTTTVVLNGMYDESDVHKLTMYLDQDGLLAPGPDASVWPMKARLDNPGTDAALKSIISASKSP